jgi:RNA polymerase sigma-70 factor (ECF subfamily)
MGYDRQPGAAIQVARIGRSTPSERVLSAAEPLASSPDDAALVDGARLDPAAFAPLYDRYFEPVYRYCHRRLGDDDRAAEATAQVFVRAIAALPRYAATGSFRSWIFAIAHNAVVDGYRERRCDASLEDAAEIPDPDPGHSPEDMAIASESYRTVTDVLARLPEEQRRVVELRLAGLTGLEIAAATGRSLAAVKSLQFRAYTRLRRLLGEDGPRRDVP